ncbi:MAG: glycosyltransferase family 4 protein [Melioribacteraceae bacterium]
MEFAGKHFLLIVENNSVPFDKRVWREAVALKDEGATVSVIAPKYGIDSKEFEIIDSINVFRYNLKFSDGSKFGYILEYFFAFIKTFLLFHKVWFSKGKFQVVHVANPPDIFWPLAIYCKLFNIKFIFDEHDLTPETLLSRFEIAEHEAGMLYKILKTFQYLSYKYSDAVISTNETYRQKAIEKFPQNREKIFIVRNGPDTRKFKLVSPNNSLKKGKQYLFAYIGIMAVQDGVDYIINSIKCLVNEKNFNDFIVYLIGSGSDLDRLKKMTQEYKLEEYIQFTGRIPDTPALEILSTADICLSPDPYNPLNDSSTMNKVMEFMSLGKPIVSFNLKEAKFSAQDAAIYIKNNDITAFTVGILELIKNKEKAKIMGEFGKKRVEKELSWQNQIINLVNTYKFILTQ